MLIQTWCARLCLLACFVTSSSVSAVEPQLAETSQIALLRTKAEELANARRWPEAIKTGGEWLALSRQTNGGGHPDVALVELFLGTAREQLGEHLLAEEHFRRAVVVLEKALPPNAPEIPSALTQLAANLKTQRRYDEALPLLARALDLQVQTLGPQHPQIAWAQRNVGWIYRLKSDPARALPFFEKALAIHRAAPTADPEVVAASLLELEQLHDALGNLAAAEQCASERLALFEKQFGAQSREAAAARGAVGHFAMRQERFAEAEAHFRKALESWETLLDAADPQRGVPMTDLGWSLQKLGRSDEAVLLLERALELRQRGSGPASGQTAKAHQDLGGLLRLRGDFEGALPHLEEALKIFERTRGEADPETLQSLAELAELHRLRGAWDVAEALAISARDRAEKRFGTDSAEAATALRNLTDIYDAAQRWPVARLAAETLLARQTARLGSEHPETAATRNRLARVCSRAGDFAASREQYATLLRWFDRQPGTDPQWRSDVLREEALVTLQAGARSEAAMLFERSAKWNEEAFGTDHTRTLRSVHDLWTFHETGGETARALQIANELATRTTRALGASAPATIAVSERLAELYAVSGDRASAGEWRRRILDSVRQQSGADAPETLTALARLAAWHEQAGEFASAIPLRLERVRLIEAKSGQGSEEAQQANGELAAGYRASGDFAKALVLYRKQLSHIEGRSVPEEDRRRAILKDIAAVHGAEQDWRAAAELRALLARTAKPNTSEHALALIEWGDALLLAGDPKRARDTFQQASREAKVAAHPALQIRATCALISGSLRAGDKASAADILKQLLDANPTVRDEAAANALSKVGRELEDAGELQSADQAYSAALGNASESAGDLHHQRIETLQRLGIVQLRGDESTAAPLLERALAASEALNGSASATTIDLLGWVALARAQCGRFPEAAVAAAQMIERRRAAFGEGPAVETARAVSAFVAFQSGVPAGASSSDSAVAVFRDVLGAWNPLVWCGDAVLSASGLHDAELGVQANVR
ncbi:MAG TPA: tetratricopeptide repeat protein [Chthoniobacteraceae bacterium]|nr:tetratricopeptide repeat protein [Chthoniobacteraceae bacterium]